MAGNLSAGSPSYIQNGMGQQSGASFNVGGNGRVGGGLTVGGVATVGGALTVSRTGDSSVAGSLQMGEPSTSYGTFLQTPMVTTTSNPPTTMCTGSTAGRLVIQYDSTKVRTTLWSWSSAAVWTELAHG